MNQKGFIGLINIFAFLIVAAGICLLGYLAWSNNILKPGQDSSSLKQSTQNELSKPSCQLSDQGCWFDALEGKMGYGSVKGYFKSVNREAQSCDSFFVLEQNQVFYHIISIDYDEKDNPVLPLDLSNLSAQLQQKIRNSSLSKPVTLEIVQVPTGGHGYKGCMPPSFSILNATD